MQTSLGSLRGRLFLWDFPLGHWRSTAKDLAEGLQNPVGTWGVLKMCEIPSKQTVYPP